MNKTLLIEFIVFNAINVIIQTVKSLCTVKGGKLVAATANALAYGLYTYIVCLMVCELPMIWKALIIGTCNFIGVYFVKWLEEKVRKDKIWKIELTIPTEYLTTVDTLLIDIPHSYIQLSDKHTLFNFYCATQQETIEVKKIVDQYNAKYFISETKNF
jgi:uncharacterized protein YebE (UPF0316 family)